MTSIDYFGIKPESIDLINSDEFRAALTAHPSLRLVTISEDQKTRAEIIADVTLPVPEDHDDYVAVIDSDNDELMWILYDDWDTIYDPSPAFIEILKVMGAYSIRNLNSRLFLTKDDNLANDEEGLTAEYDFAKGEYIL